MSLPASWTTVPVTATYTKRNGSPAQGYVTFDSMQPVVIGGQVIVPDTIRADLDSNGQISVQLPATNDPDLSTTGWAYTVNEHIDNGRGPYLLEVPYTIGAIDLSAIVAATPNPSTPVGSALHTTDIGTLVVGIAQLALPATGASLVGYTPTSTGTPGTVKSFLDSLWDSNGANLVKFDPPASTDLAQSISVALSNGVPVTWFATAATLATDATAATQAAINYAVSSGRKMVYFPGGYTYNFAAASAALDPGTGDITFVGDGQTSVIQFNEGSSTGAAADRKHLFRNTANTAKGSLEFRNLYFKGTWTSGGFVERGGAIFYLDYYTEIKIHGCRFYDFSWMISSCEAIGRASVIGNTFERSVRDMVRFRSTFNVEVLGNTFKNCDDDAIALHQSDQLNTNGTVREGIVIAGNIFEDIGTVRCLAGRMVQVRNNTFRRCKTGAILVYADVSAYTEGDVPVFGVDISGNHIFDTLARAPFSSPASSAISVYSRGRKGGSSSSNVVPGENNTSTGAFPRPWDYRVNAYSVSAASLPPIFFFRICDNTIARTLPAVSEYDDWGYGTAMAATGFSNAAVNDAALKLGIGIYFEGDARKSLIAGNTISHVAEGISGKAATSHYSGDALTIRHNNISDYTTGAIVLETPGSNYASGLSIEDNEIDGDPYHAHSNRGSGGTWSASSTPYAFKLDGYVGYRLSRNKVRNVSLPLKSTTYASAYISDNILRCDPAGVGYSASNRGIADVSPAGPQWTYEIFDCDPTSANYNNQKNMTLKESASIPASGFYVAGEFVHAQGSTTLLGWKRLTTGTAHVSGTDWKTVVLT